MWPFRTSRALQQLASLGENLAGIGRDLAELKVSVAASRRDAGASALATGTALRTILSKETAMSDTLDDVKATADETVAKVHQLVTVATTQTASIADLTAKLDAALAQPTLDATELSAINAELKGANQEIVNVLAPVAPEPPAEPAPTPADGTTETPA